jgi:hypothetical protein
MSHIKIPTDLQKAKFEGFEHTKLEGPDVEPCTRHS